MRCSRSMKIGSDDNLWRSQADEGETPPWKESLGGDDFLDAVESEEDLEDQVTFALADANKGSTI